jgi:hypothetical protein
VCVRERVGDRQSEREREEREREREKEKEKEKGSRRQIERETEEREREERERERLIRLKAMSIKGSCMQTKSEFMRKSECMPLLLPC